MRQNPAYSIGKAVRVIDLNSNPFYGYCTSCKIILEQKFYFIFYSDKYIYIYIKGSKMTGGPGPATYQYEKHSDPSKSSVPAYSIGRASRWPAYYIF